MMPELVVDVPVVTIRGHELVQAIYTLINSNQDFKPQAWSVDDAEILLAAGRKILVGLKERSVDA